MMIFGVVAGHPISSQSLSGIKALLVGLNAASYMYSEIRSLIKNSADEEHLSVQARLQLSVDFYVARLA